MTVPRALCAEKKEAKERATTLVNGLSLRASGYTGRVQTGGYTGRVQEGEREEPRLTPNRTLVPRIRTPSKASTS